MSNMANFIFKPIDASGYRKSKAYMVEDSAALGTGIRIAPNETYAAPIGTLISEFVPAGSVRKSWTKVRLYRVGEKGLVDLGVSFRWPEEEKDLIAFVDKYLKNKFNIIQIGLTVEEIKVIRFSLENAAVDGYEEILKKLEE